jgi:hypothetical protein
LLENRPCFPNKKSLTSSPHADWAGASIETSRCTDGITNVIIKLKNLDKREVILARVYGQNTEVRALLSFFFAPSFCLWDSPADGLAENH